MQRSTAASGILATVLVVAGVTILWRRSNRQKKKDAANPQIVIVFSGKRKSGKDYVTDRLCDSINRHIQVSNIAEAGICAIGRLSGPLKKAYAEEHGLDYNELLSDGPYKEQYRQKMIVWGETKRKHDPGFFARIVLKNEATCPVLIISDARRGSDLDYFMNRTKKSGKSRMTNDPSSGADDGELWECLAVRIEASTSERAGRGFVFAPSVDNGESECGLDGRGGSWDVVVNNDGEAALPEEEHGSCEGATSAPPNDTAPSPWDRTEVGRRGGVDRQIEALATEVLRRLCDES